MLVTTVFRRHFTITSLAIIVCMAFAIRLYKLDSVPQGVLDDEASHGYIAYSLLKTGRDERGNFLPLHFEAFGDEKLPGYPYVLATFVSVLGLNNFSTRLPSAFSGGLLVIVMYAIVRALNKGESVALFAAMVTAFSPWSIVLSRMAFESNVALLFFCLGLWMMVLSTQTQTKVYLYLTLIFFAITWYMYIPYRLVTFILFSIYLLYRIRSRSISLKTFFASVVFGLLLISPLITHTLTGQGATRLRQIGLYNDMGIKHMVDDRRVYCMQVLPAPVCTLYANRPFTVTHEMVMNVARSVSFEFLFLTAEKNILYLSVSNWGVFPIVLLPFYVLGLYGVLRDYAKHRVIHGFIIISLALVSLPSALVGEPQRVRLSPLLPFIVLIVAYGFGLMERAFHSLKVLRIFRIATTTVIIIYTGYFITDYFVYHIPKLKIDYESNIPGVMRFLNENAKGSDVYFDKFNNNFPMLYAYYNTVDPTDYQTFARYSARDSGGFSHPVAYKNLQRAERQLSELICDHRRNKSIFYFVSTEAIPELNGRMAKPVYTELSGDGQSVITYIHDRF